MAKINQLDKLDRVAKLLPPLLVYHYFDWALNTEHEDFNAKFNLPDTPHEIKNIMWYNELHDNIMVKVSRVMRRLYYPHHDPQEIENLTIAGLGLAYLNIPPWEEWEEGRIRIRSRRGRVRLLSLMARS